VALIVLIILNVINYFYVKNNVMSADAMKKVRLSQKKVKEIYAFMLESIEKLTNNGQTGNFALKLTGLISIDILSRMNTA